MSATSSTVAIDRAGLACQTCRQRKRKCDRRLPRCGHCTRRNLRCLSTLPYAARSGPGIVEDLKQELALLESEIAQLIPATAGLSSRESPSPSQATSLRDSSVLNDSNTGQSQSQIPGNPAIDLSFLKDPETTVLYSGEQYGLRQMTHRALEIDNSNPGGTREPTEKRALVTASRWRSQTAHEEESHDERTSRRMSAYAENYFLHVHPAFPLVDKDATMQQLQKLSRNNAFVVEERIVTYLVLAIGAALPLDSNFLSIHDSTRYFLLAHEESYAYDDTLESVTILLLFTIYSLLDPSTGSSWQLVELAMQTCIVLGLHRSRGSSSLGEYADNSRENLFRVTYLLDYLISSSLGLPRSIGNPDIFLHPLDGSSDALSLSMLYQWAHSLSESGDERAALDYSSVHQDSYTYGSNTLGSESAFVSFVGFHLSIQTMARHSQDGFQRLGRHPLQQFLERTTPPPWPLIKRPWIVGFSIFQGNLLKVLFWNELPTLQKTSSLPQLAESLLHGSQILTQVSSRFTGLSDYTELLRAFHALITSANGKPRPEIAFLERTNLHDMAAAALRILSRQEGL